jgi:hypothetical protein
MLKNSLRSPMDWGPRNIRVLLGGKDAEDRTPEQQRMVRVGR